MIPDQTWAGLVIGDDGMSNADMIQVVADGSDSKVLDLFSTGYFQPEEKENPAIDWEFEEVDGEVIFKVTRQLAPKNSDQHYVLKLDKEIQFSLTANTRSPSIS